MRKYSIDDIKRISKNLDSDLYYELLDTEYVNSKYKYTFLTIEGYKIVANLDRLQAGDKAPIFHKSNPYCLENMKLFVKKNCDTNLYYELLDIEYKGNDFLYCFKTIDGYKIVINLNNLQRGNKARIFHTSNPYSYENMLKYIEKNCDTNLYHELLDTEYKGTTFRYTFKTIDDYKVSISLINLQQGFKTSIFSESNPYSYENMLKYIEKNCDTNLYHELLDTEYKGTTFKYTFKTIDDYKIMINFECIQRGNKAHIFHTSNPYSLENMKLYIQKNCDTNLYHELLDEEYKGNNFKYTFKSIDGYKVVSSLNLLKQGFKTSIFSKFNPYRYENILRYIDLNYDTNLYYKLIDDKFYGTEYKYIFENIDGYKLTKA